MMHACYEIREGVRVSDPTAAAVRIAAPPKTAGSRAGGPAGGRAGMCALARAVPSVSVCVCARAPVLAPARRARPRAEEASDRPRLSAHGGVRASSGPHTAPGPGSAAPGDTACRGRRPGRQRLGDPGAAARRGAAAARVTPIGLGGSLHSQPCHGSPSPRPRGEARVLPVRPRPFILMKRGTRSND